MTYLFTGTKWLVRAGTRYADHARRNALSDPELIELTTPDTELGCKRVLITSEWFPALERDNVELVAGGVERITEAGVVGPDGVERPADTIIWGTGFQSHDFVAPMRIEGLGGRELNEVWADRPEAYLGTTVAGFPNMFVMYGPNTNHGSGSVPYTLECQFNYVAGRDPPPARAGPPLDRPAPGGAGGLAARDGGALGQDAVGDRRQQLVRERRGDQHQQLAGPVAGVPAPHPEAEPGRVPRGQA